MTPGHAEGNAQRVLEFVPNAPSTAILDKLAGIMRELAIERGEDGVTVARTLHVALSRQISTGPAGSGEDSRKGSWRGQLGKRAGLVVSGRTERVDPDWFPDAHYNRQSVWVLPRYVKGAA